MIEESFKGIIQLICELFSIETRITHYNRVGFIRVQYYIQNHYSILSQILEHAFERQKKSH